MLMQAQTRNSIAKHDSSQQRVKIGRAQDCSANNKAKVADTIQSATQLKSRATKVNTTSFGQVCHLTNVHLQDFQWIQQIQVVQPWFMCQ